MFKYLPDVDIPRRDAIPAGLPASILVSIGRYLIGLYLDHSAVVSTCGAAGSPAIILPRVSFSSQLLLPGAEFQKSRR
jgi:membrane protein